MLTLRHQPYNHFVGINTNEWVYYATPLTCSALCQLFLYFGSYSCKAALHRQYPAHRECATKTLDFVSFTSFSNNSMIDRRSLNVTPT